MNVQDVLERFVPPKPNPWKGFVTGAIGGAAGAAAMGGYWKLATSLRGKDPREESPPEDSSHILDDISLIGKHYEKGESSTATMGRLLYQLFTGKAPQSDETKNTLSYTVHYGYSSLMAGFYGAVRETGKVNDVVGGLTFGTGVWLVASEIALPVLGLSPGPTTQANASHLYAWGAHLVYGVTTSVTAHLLSAVL